MLGAGRGARQPLSARTAPAGGGARGGAGAGAREGGREGGGGGGPCLLAVAMGSGRAVPPPLRREQLLPDTSPAAILCPPPAARLHDRGECRPRPPPPRPHAASGCSRALFWFSFRLFRGFGGVGGEEGRLAFRGGFDGERLGGPCRGLGGTGPGMSLRALRRDRRSDIERRKAACRRRCH